MQITSRSAENEMQRHASELLRLPDSAETLPAVARSDVGDVTGGGAPALAPATSASNSCAQKLLDSAKRSADAAANAFASPAISAGVPVPRRSDQSIRVLSDQPGDAKSAESGAQVLARQLDTCLTSMLLCCRRRLLPIEQQ